MIEIKDLLLKFNNLLLSKDVKKESIRDALISTLNLDIKKEQIEIKNNIIYLNIKPIYKNEILINKERIFQKLNENFKGKPPQDIR